MQFNLYDFKKSLTTFEDQIAFHQFEQALPGFNHLCRKYPEFWGYIAWYFETKEKIAKEFNTND